MSSKPKCGECGTKFDVDEARTAYNAEFNGDLDYDDDIDGECCGNCAISQSQSNMNVGAAIDMMNGEEAYDEDFVNTHL